MHHETPRAEQSVCASGAPGRGRRSDPPHAPGAATPDPRSTPLPPRSCDPCEVSKDCRPGADFDIDGEGHAPMKGGQQRAVEGHRRVKTLGIALGALGDVERAAGRREEQRQQLPVCGTNQRTVRSKTRVQIAGIQQKRLCRETGGGGNESKKRSPHASSTYSRRRGEKSVRGSKEISNPLAPSNSPASPPVSWKALKVDVSGERARAVVQRGGFPGRSFLPSPSPQLGTPLPHPSPGWSQRGRTA